MPEKPHARTLRHSQQGSKTLLKSGQQGFSDIFSSFWKKICSKNSVLVVSKILKLFINILTPDDKYSQSVKGSV